MLWVFEFTEQGSKNGFWKTEPIGAEHRNQIAASASLAVAGGTASGAALSAEALVLDSSKALPGRLVLMAFNGSDADSVLALNNQISIGGSLQSVVVEGASQIALPAGTGISVIVQGAAFGDASPQVSGSTTSAAVSGGDITVQLRYI